MKLSCCLRFGIDGFLKYPEPVFFIQRPTDLGIRWLSQSFFWRPQSAQVPVVIFFITDLK
jgi:hypothetical protein